MRRTRNARVVVADRLLALPGQLVERQVGARRDKGAQVGFDGGLILRRRRRDLCSDDSHLFIQHVAVAENAARRFGAATPAIMAGHCAESLAGSYSNRRVNNT